MLYSWCCTETTPYYVSPLPGLRRSRRTLDRLCGSEQFVNAMVRTMMDESRSLLSSTEPLVLGDGPNWRNVRFSNGRLWGAASVHLSEPVVLRCNSTHLLVALHTALNNSELAYDWEYPGTLLSSRGSVSFFSRHMAFICAVVLPRQLSDGRARVVDVRITALRGADVTVAGPWPLAPLVAFSVNKLLRKFPDQLATVVSGRLKDGFQRYLDEQLAGIN
ncbi:uncharacterized protein LOC144102239 [Amblyomma americanum]